MARKLDDPFVLAHTLGWNCEWPLQWLLKQDEARDRFEESLALSEEYGFPEPLRIALQARAHWLFRCGRYDEALAQLHQVDAMERGLDEGHVPHRLLLLAEIHGKMGYAEEAVRLEEQALETLSKSGQAESFIHPCCLKGELLTQLGDESSLREAQDCFRTAMDIARRTQAKAGELRVAMGWARLLQAQGRTEEAREMLAEVYGWFTEGFDTPFLREARALLEELSSSPPDSAP